MADEDGVVGHRMGRRRERGAAGPGVQRLGDRVVPERVLFPVPLSSSG
ncbi:hypothetical protein [Streptomyces sp. BRA346]